MASSAVELARWVLGSHKVTDKTYSWHPFKIRIVNQC